MQDLRDGEEADVAETKRQNWIDQNRSVDRISYESQDRPKKDEALAPPIKHEQHPTEVTDPVRTPDHGSKTETLQIHHKSIDKMESGSEGASPSRNAQHPVHHSSQGQAGPYKDQPTVASKPVDRHTPIPEDHTPLDFKDQQMNSHSGSRTSLQPNGAQPAAIAGSGLDPETAGHNKQKNRADAQAQNRSA